MTGRLLALTLGAVVLASCGGPTPATQVVSATPLATRPAVPTPTAAPQEIRVYVTGAVAKPGVYDLTPDSRVEDAVTAAGGFVDGADMPRVNLAARVRDEQEIFVPRVGETDAGPVSKTVNVNTASSTQLRDGLGISSTLASRIVAYRRAHGPFRSVDDLRQVPVPDADLTRIRAQVTTN